MILEDYIALHARRCPDKPALVCGHDTCTYEALENRIQEKAMQLEKASYRKGQIVCLRAVTSIDYLVTYFALHRLGCVVTPLEKDLPEDSFQNLSRELGSHTVPDGTADILYTTGTTGKSKGVIISHRTILADAENLIDGQGFSHEQFFSFINQLQAEKRSFLIQQAVKNAVSFPHRQFVQGLSHHGFRCHPHPC